MGRWSQYDDDDYRLPEGVKRVGYDADTQKYTYQDADGSYWEGAEGARYGTLRRVQSSYSPTSRQATTSPSQAHAPRTNDPTDAKAAKKRDWHLFAPFVLLVSLILLLLFRLLMGAPAWGARPGLEIACGEHETVHTIQAGETCYGIAQKYGMSLDSLRAVNEGLECDSLRPGGGICVD